MENLVISECNYKNIVQLKYICEKTFYETFIDDNSEEDMEEYLKSNFTHAQLEKEIENQYSKIFIVKKNEEVVAYMKVNFDKAQTEEGYKDTLEVQRIYVLKEYKGQGIGKLLMKKAIEITRSNNLKYIWLGVWEHNYAAIKFYEKKGFEKFSTHVFKLGDDEQTDYLMKLIL